MRNAMLSISLRYCFAEKELLLNAREKISFRNRKQKQLRVTTLEKRRIEVN